MSRGLLLLRDLRQLVEGMGGKFVRLVRLEELRQALDHLRFVIYLYFSSIKLLDVLGAVLCAGRLVRRRPLRQLRLALDLEDASLARWLTLDFLV